jgi:hypothetical protein
MLRNFQDATNNQSADVISLSWSHEKEMSNLQLHWWTQDHHLGDAKRRTRCVDLLRWRLSSWWFEARL